jgi:hypothetical protein
MAVVFAFALRVINRMSDEIKYQEDIIDAKNDALKYYVDAYQEKVDELLKFKISAATKKPGRPKGSKNKVTKPTFDKVKFNEKYGK